MILLGAVKEERENFYLDELCSGMIFCVDVGEGEQEREWVRERKTYISLSSLNLRKEEEEKKKNEC